ncbi:MAG: leucyl aminopeptidase [Gammaproteobacteria bacterium TMED119]|nr:MAG: leucyl aminopeptidase [Gammaproteobacteria bacterium TMED119]RCL45946.1 MAG: leucyl aminopeptidase [Candidatus Thioglobus sp.]
MQYLAKKSPLHADKSACAIVALAATKKLDEQTKTLDQHCQGVISRALKNGDFTGRLGETLVLQTPEGSPHKRILLVGYGKPKALNIIAYKKIITACANRVKTTGAADVSSMLCTLPVSDATPRILTRMHIMLFSDTFYRYDHTLSNKTPSPKLKRIKLMCTTAAELKDIKHAMPQGIAIAAGMLTTKELGNLPANICTPTYLADRAKQIKRGQRKLSVDVLNEADMKKLGMGALLSVSAGSAQPAKLIAMQYTGGKTGSKPVVLVGKGITFDTGGISIKPSNSMDEMKFDMCGAATVLGTMQAIAAMQLPLNVVALVAAAENMPGGKATKPGDVVTSMSGQTIEILNTDAEGRLVLCDALTYAQKFDPDVVIDMATLTGACLVALGHEASGLMSNSDKLSDELLAAGHSTGDRAWRLPIWQEYQPLLDSNFADMGNIGGRWAGSITAACFLARYAEDYNWAHLDIAGTAWHMGKNKGATGRPVPLLTEYLLRKARTA